MGKRAQEKALTNEVFELGLYNIVVCKHAHHKIVEVMLSIQVEQCKQVVRNIPNIQVNHMHPE